MCSSSKRLNFDDTSHSFASRSNGELIRAYCVLRLCQVSFLTKNARKLYEFGNRVSPRLTEWALRRTFFGHFCAGVDQNDIVPVIDRLDTAGIGSILDYAAEADVTEEEEAEQEQISEDDDTSSKEFRETKTYTVPSLEQRDVLQARTYEYEGEAECDANVEIFKSCIESAARSEDGFAAIKMTALGKPELLQHITNVIHEARRAFRHVVNSGNVPDMASAPKGQSPIHATGWDCSAFYLNSVITYDDFVSHVLKSNLAVTEDEAKDQFVALDRDGNGMIDFHEWLDQLELHRLASSAVPNPLRTKYLSSTELSQLDNMTSRADLLGEYAASRKTNLMIDAEQTYMQPAIDHQVLLMQRLHNKEVGYVFNTYQCYLRDTFSRVAVDFLRAEREGFHFAAKIVRGAYMFQERERAAQLKFNDPVQPDIQSTHDNYNAIVAKLLSEVNRTSCRIMIASHNEDSVNRAVGLIEEHGIKDNVYFGQLLGMCDHVTYMLGSHGLKGYKYVPYGPVDEVMPYLIRRAEENSDLLGGSTREIQLTLNELSRRLTGRS